MVTPAEEVEPLEELADWLIVWGVAGDAVACPAWFAAEGAEVVPLSCEDP